MYISPCVYVFVYEQEEEMRDRTTKSPSEQQKAPPSLLSSRTYLPDISADANCAYCSKETYYSVKRDLLQCQKRRTVSADTNFAHGL